MVDIILIIFWTTFVYFFGCFSSLCKPSDNGIKLSASISNLLRPHFILRNIDTNERYRFEVIGLCFLVLISIPSVVAGGICLVMKLMCISSANKVFHFVAMVDAIAFAIYIAIKFIFDVCIEIRKFVNRKK